MVELDPALRAHKDRIRPPTSGGQMLAIASGKGGVGKTWFAITLAHRLALAGKRTLLFDGDLGLANVDIQLGLMPEHDLAEVIAGRNTMQGVIARSDSAAIDIIAGRSGGGNLAALPEARLTALLDELAGLASGYDRTILDLGAGLENTVRTLAAAADTVIVVATDEPTSLTDAYAFIKLLALRQDNADIRIVVNMASSARGPTHLRHAAQGLQGLSADRTATARRDPTGQHGQGGDPRPGATVGPLAQL